MTSSVAAFDNVLAKDMAPWSGGVISLPIKDTARLLGGVIKAERDYKEGFVK